jgi:hypothetical protein
MHRDRMADKTRDLELLCGEHLQRGVESHKKVVVVIFVKYPGEGLLVH